MNFVSSAYANGLPFRVLADKPTEITATIPVPEGYALQTADKLYAFKIGADHVINEITVSCNALDRAQTATLTLDCGYEAAVATDDPNAFIAATTGARAGTIISVNNGGDDPFAVGVLAALDETIDIMLQPAASASSTAGSGTVGPAEGGGLVTVTAKISRRQNVAEAGTQWYTPGEAE